jgi:hypothetical protein
MITEILNKNNQETLYYSHIGKGGGEFIYLYKGQMGKILYDTFYLRDEIIKTGSGIDFY